MVNQLDQAEEVDSDDDQAIQDWKEFIETNDIDLNVVGIGKNVSTTYLDIIQVVDGKSPVVVTDETQLVDTLAEIVNSVEVTGTLADNIDFDGDGELNIDSDFSAKGSILSITIDGVTHEATDGNLSNLETVAGGKLTFDFTSGDYTYTLDGNISVTEVFSVVAKNIDGDTTSLQMTINGDGNTEVIDTDVIIEDDNSTLNEGIITGSGNDTVTVGNDQNGTVDTENGNDTVTINGNQNGTVNTGSGNDVINVLNDSNDDGVNLRSSDEDSNFDINTGSADDEVNIGNNQNAEVSTSDGKDTVTIGNNSNAKVATESGDDTVNVGNDQNGCYRFKW